MKNPNPGRPQIPSNNIRKTWDSLVSQTHSIRNGLPIAIPKQNGVDRSRSNLEQRINSIKRAIIKTAIKNKKR